MHAAALATSYFEKPNHEAPLDFSKVWGGKKNEKKKTRHAPPQCAMSQTASRWQVRINQGMEAAINNAWRKVGDTEVFLQKKKEISQRQMAHTRGDEDDADDMLLGCLSSTYALKSRSSCSINKS